MRILKPNIKKMKEKKDISGIIAVLHDQDYELRDAAAKALGQIGDIKSIEPLIEALKDKGRSMLWSASRALAEIGKPSVKPLLECINHDDIEVRKASIKALGIIGDKQAADFIANALKDKDKNVAYEAAIALEKLGDERGIKKLKKLEADKKLSQKKYISKKAKKDRKRILFHVFIFDSGPVIQKETDYIKNILNSLLPDAMLESKVPLDFKIDNEIPKEIGIGKPPDLDRAMQYYLAWFTIIKKIPDINEGLKSDKYTFDWEEYQTGRGNRGILYAFYKF